MISKKAEIAYNKGYRVIHNAVFSPFNKRLKLYPGTKTAPYPEFSIKHNKKRLNIRAHHLAAWQKFKEKCIGNNIIIRHLDDNPFNFRLNNLELGNQSDNAYDRERNYKTKINLTFLEQYE